VKLDELKKLLPIFKRLDVIAILLLFVILVAIEALSLFGGLLSFESLMTVSILILLLAMSIFLFHEISQTFETQESLNSLKSEIKASLAEHDDLWFAQI
jgi:hypothetical protein